MFVVAEPEAALRLALDVVAAFPAGGETPPARVGLAAGRVVALRGDFYGPAVHLAARLADAAAPATVLAAPDLRARAGEAAGVVFHALGARRLAGFDEPVVPHEVRRR